MGRPLKQGLTFFPHDTDASTDEKIEAMRTFFGNDGYAFYFIILERIYRSESCELDISDADTKQILARKLMVTDQKLAEMIQKSTKIGLFDKGIFDTNHILTSNGIKRRASYVFSKRNIERERYHKKEGISAAETTPESTQLNETKLNETKLKEINKEKFDDVQKYYEEKMGKLVDHQSCELINKGLEIYPLDWIKEAIDITKQNDGSNFAYANKILSGWTITRKNGHKSNGVQKNKEYGVFQKPE